MHRRARTSLGDRFDETFFGTSPNLPRVAEIPLACLEPNPSQPREVFDEADLDGLAVSIERYGLIHPIVVQPLRDGDRYRIVVGERRFRAFQRLGSRAIPAIITDGDPEELALIENMQRSDLDPLEEAAGMARLMDRRGYTQEELGRALGRKQNTVSEILRLNTLPEEIKLGYRTSDNRVSKAVLIEVSRVRDSEAQRRLWEELKEGASVRQARARKAERRGSASYPRSAAEVLAAGRRFLRRLQCLPASDIVADRDRYRELLALRDELDTVIGRCADAEADPPPGKPVASSPDDVRRPPTQHSGDPTAGSRER